VKLLRQWLEKHGEDKYLELIEKFPRCGEVCGYTLNDIKYMNVDGINYGPLPEI